jgi:predicted nucleotidyltransferase
MSTSNQSYKELAIPYFREVFECIDRIMIGHGIPYYLIGVNAIALELLKSGIKPNRGTKDIDFAIMISSKGEYERISRSLSEATFSKVKNAPWTFYSERFSVAIDVLPFGEIEEHYATGFAARQADLHVLGFKEVLAESVPAQIEELVVHIPPLPGMVLLKLIAWSDRPEERDNDLSDILKIIQHYYDLCYNEILDYHQDLISDGPIDELMTASELLGRKSRHFLEKSEKLKLRLQRILDENLSEVSQSRIAREWARKLDRDMQYAHALLLAFWKGLFE